VKKLSKLMFIFVVVLALAGCVKRETTMTIGKDKSMNLVIIHVLDKEGMKQGMIDKGGSSSEIEDGYLQVKASLEPFGYVVERYYEGEKEGYKITKSFNNIDEISKDSLKVQDLIKIEDENFDHTHYFKKTSNSSQDTYEASYTFNMEDESLNPAGINYYNPYFDTTYIVSLPHKSDSHNATTVSNDGKTLTWDLELGSVNAVNFTFSIPKQNSSNNIAIYVGGAMIGLAIVIVIVVVLLSKKGKKTKSSEIRMETPTKEESSINKLDTNEDNRVVDITVSNLESSIQKIGETEVIRKERNVNTPLESIEPATLISELREIEKNNNKENEENL